MEEEFLRTVCRLAIPVALQSMLQASFSIVDQVMIGQLGSVSVAGVGLAGKFSSIYTVVVSAIGAVAGIMISQYIGQRNEREISRSFFVNLEMAVGLAILFTVLAVFAPERILGLYAGEQETIRTGAAYLKIMGGTFLPAAGATLMSAMLRCMEKASLPLYASIAAAILNTVINYILIFGKFGFPALGANGAAIATLISQWANCLLMLAMILKYKEVFRGGHSNTDRRNAFNWKQYLYMLLPVLICEFVWSLGENVYAGIYGHLGTQAMAAMTLTNPVQGLMIGALCGISQAAAIIMGKRLGNAQYEEAYAEAKKLLFYGFVGAVTCSLLIVAASSWYVTLYQVEGRVWELTQNILFAYAVIAPVKVQNMILGSGILRSGGKTKYVMAIDLTGTWIFGVPLGMIFAFIFHLPVFWVYFILSLEECVRFLMSLLVFRSRRWMRTLES